MGDIKAAFKKFDKKSSGKVSISDITQILKELEIFETDEEIKKILSANELDKKKTLELSEVTVVVDAVKAKTAEDEERAAEEEEEALMDEVDEEELLRKLREANTWRCRKCFHENMPTNTECASCHAPKGKTEYKEVSTKDLIKSVDVKQCKELLLLCSEGDSQLKEVQRICSLVGVDVNFQDENGETAILIASARSASGVVEHLLKMTADVNHRAWKTGYTALMRAAKASSKSCVRILLQGGADPAIKNNLKETAFDLAGAFDAERTTDIQKILYEELKLWMRRVLWEFTSFPSEVIDLILEYHLVDFQGAASDRAERLEHSEMLDLDHDRLLRLETEEERRRREQEEAQLDMIRQQREAGLRQEWQMRGGGQDYGGAGAGAAPRRRGY